MDKATLILILQNGIDRLSEGSDDQLKTLQAMEAIIRKFREDLEQKTQLNAI